MAIPYNRVTVPPRPEYNFPETTPVRNRNPLLSFLGMSAAISFGCAALVAVCGGIGWTIRHFAETYGDWTMWLTLPSAFTLFLTALFSAIYFNENR